jgi:hypothetical protein
LALSLVGVDVRATCDPVTGAMWVTLGEMTVVAAHEGLAARTDDPVVVEQGDDTGWVVMGETGAGTPYRLTLGETWRLLYGTDESTIEPPRLLRNAGDLRVLGRGVDRIWIGAAGLLGSVEVSTGRVEVARLAWRRALPSLVMAGDSALIVAGRDLLACPSPSACARVARLPGPATRVVAGDSGVLLALSGAERGLYRAVPGRLDEATCLAEGTVETVCTDGSGHAWALLRRGRDVRVVAAATSTPALRAFAPTELLVEGVLDPEEPEAEAATRVLAVAVKEDWPELQRLALALYDDRRPTVRRAAAAALGSLRSARATAALWLLGHDADRDVRLDALYASVRRCGEDPRLTCAQMLGTFLSDSAPAVAWSARDAMLEEDPHAALRRAPTAYKLDAIAGLVSRLQRNGTLAARRALELLAADRDPKVRSAARIALVGNLP